MTERDQKILLKGCRKGKPAAQKELYDLFASDMFKVCLMYSTDYDGANDLLQEGFLKVFQKIHLFKIKEQSSLAVGLELSLCIIALIIIGLIIGRKINWN